MPRCRHCVNELGKPKAFQTNKFNSHHCLETEECIKAWRDDRIKGEVKLQKKADKQTRESLKTRSDHENDLQKEINRIVLAIDKNHPCIATRATTGKRNAGHYIGVGANKTIRFHLENIWVQSEHSNMWKSGDTIRYQDGIVSLYGSEYLNRLNSLKMIKPIKLSIDELKDKIKISRSILKSLQNDDLIYTNVQRIELRQKYNEELNIYCGFKN